MIYSIGRMTSPPFTRKQMSRYFRHAFQQAKAQRTAMTDSNASTLSQAFRDARDEAATSPCKPQTPVPAAVSYRSLDTEDRLAYKPANSPFTTPKPGTEEEEVIVISTDDENDESDVAKLK